jgi:hypothetical protein
MADPIVVSIPTELTAAMIIRAGVIKSEARAENLAHELHEIVAGFRELYLAERSELSPLEIADFTLAVWRQALVNSRGDDDTADAHEAGWISETLAALDDGGDLYLRWLTIGDVVTGGDVATMMMDGGVH